MSVKDIRCNEELKRLNDSLINKNKKLQEKIDDIVWNIRRNVKLSKEIKNIKKENENLRNSKFNLKVKIESLKEELNRKTKGKQCDGKVRYDCTLDAEHALSLIQSNSVKQVKPIRKYKCYVCGGFHLTSKTRLKKS